MMGIFFIGLSLLIVGLGLHRFLLHKKLDTKNFFSSYKYFTKGEIIILIFGIVAEISGMMTMIISLIYKNRGL